MSTTTIQGPGPRTTDQPLSDDDKKPGLAEETEELAGVTMSVNGGPEIPLEQLEEAVDGALFDGKPFETARPKVDGHVVDKLRVSFSGAVELDPMLEDDLKFFNAFMLGQRVDLQIEGYVNGKPVKYTEKEGTDGDVVETTTSTVTVKVDSVTRLAPEDL